jgi:3'-phosphoadenosine 5'-phosphosulfate sulfotransferase
MSPVATKVLTDFRKYNLSAVRARWRLQVSWRGKEQILEKNNIKESQGYLASTLYKTISRTTGNLTLSANSYAKLVIKPAFGISYLPKKTSILLY